MSLISCTCSPDHVPCFSRFSRVNYSLIIGSEAIIVYYICQIYSCHVQWSTKILTCNTIGFVCGHIWSMCMSASLCNYKSPTVRYTYAVKPIEAILITSLVLPPGSSLGKVNNISRKKSLLVRSDATSTGSRENRLNLVKATQEWRKATD